MKPPNTTTDSATELHLKRDYIRRRSALGITLFGVVLTAWWMTVSLWVSDLWPAAYALQITLIAAIGWFYGVRSLSKRAAPEEVVPE